MITEERSDKHKRNTKVESCLKELESLLGPIDKEKQNQYKNPQHPTIFIMGCARSGTTLVNQLLAKHLVCCYPSNFISRFYYAPYIGSLLQKLMYDLDFNGELLNTQNGISLSSVLGKTKGALSPHEFWYFWRKYFNYGEIQKLDETLIDIDSASKFAQGLYSIQGVFNKPLLLKGMIMNWNIPYLEKLIEKSFFLFIERDTLYNAQSLLIARKEFYNDEKKWYSFYPEEYETLKDKEPEEQVVAQVYYTNQAIKKGLAQIPENKYMTVNYGNFCNNPSLVIEQLTSSLNIRKCDIEIPVKLNEEKKVKLDADSWEKIKQHSLHYK